MLPNFPVRFEAVSRQPLLALSSGAFIALLAGIFSWYSGRPNTTPNENQGHPSHQKVISDSDLAPKGVPPEFPVQSPSGRDRRSENSTGKTASGTSKLERWERIARGSRPALLSGKTLSLSGPIVSLLELTPDQAAEINSEITRLLVGLQAEEVKHAYVLVMSDGSEKIVVPPFDRQSLVMAFRSAVGATNGDDIAEFLSRQMPHDRNLVVENAEMSVHNEKDPTGTDLVVYFPAS